MPTTPKHSDGFHATLKEMERDWYGQPQTQFPIDIELGGSSYRFKIWNGEQLPDQLLGFDTETELTQGRETPEMALGIVHGDQGSCYFIHPSDLPRFVQRHAGAYWAAHNMTFDFWVVAKQLSNAPQALAVWWDIAGNGQLVCTMILDALIRLAATDAEPVNRDLAAVSAEYCGLGVNKADPFRLRFGEIIGIPKNAWKATGAEFWRYSAVDAVATLQVVQRQFAIAMEQIEPYRSELLPDALQRWGPLTCTLQVQGGIALDFVSRIGVAVDTCQVTKLHRAIEVLVEQHIETLEELGGSEIFRRYGPRSKNSGYQLSASGVPKRNAKLVKQRLAAIAKASASPIWPPRNKDGLVTDSVKYWKQHADLDPFIRSYVQFAEQSKLCQFFKKLDAKQIFPRYRPLVRTGRTSCSNPNLQQLPRDARFREMILAPPGYWLLQIDYSVLELRTLAQICLRRYGKSRMVELRA